MPEQTTEVWGAAIEFINETDEELVQAITSAQTERVRYAAKDRVPALVFEAARQSEQYVAHVPVLMQGRIELLWYLREQSISVDYHRYGNLGEKGSEGRAGAVEGCVPRTQRPGQ